LSLKKNKIRNNSMIYTIRNVMNIIFPLVTFKYASGIISASGVGAASYASAIIGYFSLIAQLGINTYALAEGAKLRSNKEKFDEFCNIMFTINVISTVFAYLVLVFFLINVKDLAKYRELILIYSVTIGLTTIGMEWIFVVEERFIYITARSIIIQAISLLLLVIFVKQKEDVAVYVGINVLANSGSYILNYFYLKRNKKIKLISIKKCAKYVKPILVIWVANVASMIYINADTIVIGSILGSVEVGIYSAASKIVKAVCVPITSICTVSGPDLASAIGKKDRNETTELTKTVITFASFLIFPCIIGSWLFGDLAILLLSGKEFLGGFTAEKILSLDIFLSPLNGFFVSQILIPAQREKKATKALVLAAIGNIILDILLIPKFFINGAAIATVFSESIVLIICLPEINKIIDLKRISSKVWNAMFCSLSIVFVYEGIKYFVENRIIQLIFTIVIGGIIYCFSYWRINCKLSK